MTEDKSVKIDYVNHRGERAIRTIEPITIFWGSSEWHPEPQWLILAYDIERKQERAFALTGIVGRVIPCQTSKETRP